MCKYIGVIIKMKKNKIIVFVKNKLITLDTVLPILIEMKEKYNMTSKIVVFDDLAYKAIHKNIVIKDAVDYVGSVIYITRGSKSKILRIMSVIFYMLILFPGFIKGNKVLHFGHLSDGVLRLISILFSKNVYHLQGSAYDFNYSLKIFEENNNIRAKQGGDNIVFFGKKIGEEYFSNVKCKKIFFFGETRTRLSWVSYIRNRSDYYFNLHHKSVDFSNGCVVYILGAIEAIDYKKRLFLNTVNILKSINLKIPILVKPHAFTEMKVVHNAIENLPMAHITYLHPSLLATKSKLFISNNFSNTLADAHSFGVPTIQYSYYDNASTEECKEKFVDYLVKDDINEFNTIIRNILSNDFNSSNFEGVDRSDDGLLLSLSS